MPDISSPYTPHRDTPATHAWKREKSKGPINGTGALTGGGALSGSGILSLGESPGGSPGGEGSFLAGEGSLGGGVGAMDSTNMSLQHVMEEDEHGYVGPKNYDQDVTPIRQPPNDGETNAATNIQGEEEKGEEDGTLGSPAGLGLGFGPIFRPGSGLAPGSGLELDDGEDGAGEGAAIESFVVEEGNDYDDSVVVNDEGSLMTKNEVWFKTSLLPISPVQKRLTKTDSLLQFLARPTSAHHLQHHHEHPFVEDQRGYAVVAQEQQELLRIQEELLAQQQQEQRSGGAKRVQSAGPGAASRSKGLGPSRLKSAPSKRGPQVALEPELEPGHGLGPELVQGIALEQGQAPGLEPETGLGLESSAETTLVNNDWFAALESEIVPMHTPIPPTDT